MKKWRVDYYKTKTFITHKFVYAKTAAQAIKRAKVKNIIDLVIIEEDATK